ncbi:response regulator [Parasedimentitalea psychrophila]|uniref:Response regulator n=1 Tax=Parasedimentitalea psychrophila TaxID=2997337 RepID=A0A9Y2P2Z6_9RHOB|nr:response regulator [Parasedimentitalea psychrophila]WIY23744.1 response regulator [Parasedimentitalea psychrophila]
MLKVLMVDDEPDAELLFRQNFRREIRKKHYEFLFAQSADQALDVLERETSPSVMALLSDINMPGMSGLELLDVVKQKKPDLPVIMITAYGDAGTESDAMKRGAVQLVSKPVDFAKLKSELAELSDQAAS